jgi:hypothetical protein
MISAGTTSSQAYINTLEKIETASAALAETKNELIILESQSDFDSSATAEDNQNYYTAQANVEKLKIELSALRQKLTEFVSADLEERDQQEPQAAFERTSAALAEVKKELAALESQTSDNSMAQLDHQLIQSNINSLTDKLTRLNEDLHTSLVRNTDALQSANSLSVGKADTPAPVLPVQRQTAMMIGGIAGLGIAWLVLNFRWLIK